jgi:hypothetical protein
VRHGCRLYLRCLNYMRQLAPSTVSLIMKQVRYPLLLSHEVSSGGARLRETEGYLAFTDLHRFGSDRTRR